MRKSFIQKVLRNLTLDTRKYRYIVKEGSFWTGHEWKWYREIWRLPLKWLDTTLAYTDWEFVWKEVC